MPRSRRRWAATKATLQDPYLFYTATLAPIVLAVALFARRPGELGVAVVFSAVAIAVQYGLGRLRLRPIRRRKVFWPMCRIAVPLLYVTASVQAIGGPALPLLTLYVPVVAAAAAVGRVHAWITAGVAAILILGPELGQLGSPAAVALRAVTLAGTAFVLAFGTRRIVAALEDALRAARFATIAERRRSRQLEALDAVGRMLAAAGPTSELLDSVLDVVASRFGYDHVSVYLGDEERVSLIAQRGYADPIESFVPGVGVAGRVMRERQIAFVPDVTSDDGYIPGKSGIESLICAPLVVDARFLGLLNVETTRPRRLEPIDRTVVGILAARIASAVALGQDRTALAELAVRDGLTGLYNRRHFDEALERLIAASRRDRLSGSRPLSAILFDLDHFGAFNKEHGHQVGDTVLRTFADVLRTRFRASDLVARLGGEEFIVILDGVDREQATAIADEVRADLASRRLVGEDGRSLAVTVSAGCAELDPEKPSREELLRTADVGLFMAKRAGRDRVVAA